MRIVVCLINFCNIYIIIMFLAIGHQGAKGYYRGNTVRSILCAKTLNADMIEIDVQLTKDNIFVLYHDNTLIPYGKKKGKELCDIEYNDLKMEGLCLLGNGLDYILCGEGSIPYLDLKIPDSKMEDKKFIKKFGDKLWEFLNEYDDIMFMASFCRDLIDYIIKKPNSDRFLYGYLYETDEEVNKINKKVSACIFDYKSKNFRENMDKVKNCDIFCYTVNDEKEMRKLKKMGIKGIVSDYPDRVVSIK